MAQHLQFLTLKIKPSIAMPLTKSSNATLVVLALLLASWFSNCPAGDKPPHKLIRLATTTSTENSGLLNFLMPQFSRQTGYQVHVIAVGTGKALRMGSDGDVDVVLVHAPEAERQFVQAGYGEQRHPVMYNDFILIGPKADPAGVNKVKNVAEAFELIYRHSARFISRGDDSGTHKKERHIWQTSNTEPGGKWYREAGQGMGKVIQIAGELNAYTLTDRGTWLSYRDKSSLKLLLEDDPALHNPYGIIAVNPERYNDTNYAGAQSLITWITSKPAQALIGSFRVSNTRLFIPAAHLSGLVAKTP